MGAATPNHTWHIEPLGKAHSRAAFSCGVPELDTYLRQNARQDKGRHVSVPFVLVDGGSTEVAGYYTLSASGVDLSDLPPETAARLPHYPVVPVTLLGRLAVDERYHGQGLGEHLLMDALCRSARAATDVASFAVMVDAKNDEARNFYLHFDFLPFPGIPNRLFLPMKTIAQLCG